MRRLSLVMWCGLAALGGCGDDQPPGLAANPTASHSGSAVAPPRNTHTDLAEIDRKPGETESAGPEDQGLEASTLVLEGIRFRMLPPSWKRVPPRVRIIDAEFELPAAPGDEHEARLTLMDSFGNPHEVIDNRAAEFRLDSVGPKIETLQVAGVAATWIDLSGEWKGPSFDRIEPRPDYRMLLVIFPFTESSAFYAKLTGPRNTVELHEREFRTFVESVQFTSPKGE
ncbi:MAG: hypothetical protein ACT4QC_06845 [Planctomycetaceae bacterium]